MLGLVGTLGAVALTVVLTQDDGDGPVQPPANPQSSTTATITRTSSGASFTSVELLGPAQSGYQYRIKLGLTGLKDQSCTLTWETVYLDDGTPGDANGTESTGTLLYDRGSWEHTVLVRPPSGAAAGRPWRTVFKVFSPDRVLLATSA